MSTGEKEFHRSRQMFAVVNKQLLLGPRDSEWSHREWFTHLGLDAVDVIEQCVRGFVDSTGLYFYQGNDFRTSTAIEAEIFKYLPELVSQLKLASGTAVYAGMKVQAVGKKWVPQKSLGSVSELIE